MSRATVTAKLRNGAIPAHFVGGSWIVFTAEIRAWIEGPPGRSRHVDVLADYGDPLVAEDLAELFGKSGETIRRWLRDGTVPASRHGTNYLSPKAHVRALLATTSHGTSRPPARAPEPAALAPSQTWLARTLAEIAAEQRRNT